MPAAGVTYVGVRATHRRRGVLGSMMQRQLTDIHDRGEPVAILWASESSIYGRYGYGLASRRAEVEIDRVDARMRGDLELDDSVTLRLVTAAELRGAAESVEAAVVDERPGQYVRDGRWIATALADPESRRRGRSALQGVLAERAGKPVGYAAYRTKPGGTRGHGLPDGEVIVTAQRAIDTGADQALTRVLLSLDLMRRVIWWNLPLDTALPHLLSDPRQAKAVITDGLHARVVDVRAALSGRRYAGPVDVVMRITDQHCPWNAGTWRLTAESGVGTCERSDREPHVVLDAETLGAVYLGGTSLVSLTDAGRVGATDHKRMLALSAALRSAREPWCPVVF
jgi:predicted acetyltransferase